ncbi:MAG: apolipoprotein N-acyltransferase [Actinomycetota bacterium]
MLVAFSLPPFGWWPLAFVGLALLFRVLEEASPRARLLLGWLAGIGMWGIGWYWFTEFTGPGGVLSIAAESLFLGVGAALVPPRAGRWAAFPAAVVLVELARGVWPFEGLPLAGVALGQVAGPLAPFGRVAGGLGLLLLACGVAVALAELLRGRVRVAAVAAVLVVLAALAGAVAPDGGPDARTINTAIVQGGGRRGFRAIESNPADVERAHFAAEQQVRGHPDLVLWPEDVIDVDGSVTRTAEAAALASIARQRRATMVVGVVEGQGTDHFHNAAVAWAPDGRIVGRYEKVRRVPFGEYIPFRSLVGRIGDISAVPADAIKGHGPGILQTPAGRLGVLISYEVFFNDRSRAAVGAGAEVLFVPTNAASFSTSQVPTQELAAARLRALETGRWLAQAGPTGYSGVIDPTGRIVHRSVLGRRQIITARLGARHGRTLFDRWGDVPVLLLALAGLVVGLVLQARAAARRD